MHGSYIKHRKASKYYARSFIALACLYFLPGSSSAIASAVCEDKSYVLQPSPKCWRILNSNNAPKEQIRQTPWHKNPLDKRQQTYILNTPKKKNSPYLHLTFSDKNTNKPTVEYNNQFTRKIKRSYKDKSRAKKTHSVQINMKIPFAVQEKPQNKK